MRVEALAADLSSTSGLVLIPTALSPETQKQLVQSALEVYARCNETNLDAHYLIPSSGIWDLHSRRDPQPILPKSSQTLTHARYDAEIKGPRQRVENEAASLANLEMLKAEPKLEPLPSSSAKPGTATDLLPRLRWANLGYLYHWGTKSYDFSKSPPLLPSELRELCKGLVAGIDWADVWNGCNEDETAGLSCEDWDEWDKTFGKRGVFLLSCDADLDQYTEPDAGIVNFYQLQVGLNAFVMTKLL